MQFTVAKVTETKNGNFLHKLVTENKVDLGDILGSMTKKITYYIFTSKRAEPETTLELDLNNPNLEIVEKERTFLDSNGKEMTAKLKYIMIKS